MASILGKMVRKINATTHEQNALQNSSRPSLPKKSPLFVCSSGCSGTGCPGKASGAASSP